jgi:hypothetical protein
MARCFLKEKSEGLSEGMSARTVIVRAAAMYVMLVM